MSMATHRPIGPWLWLMMGLVACRGHGASDAGMLDAGPMDAGPMEAGLDAGLDEAAPSWPVGATLTVSELTHEGATLSWPAAMDDVGVTSYAMYVDDMLVDTTTELMATLTGLMPDMDYVVRVEARDRAGHESTDGPTAACTGCCPHVRRLRPSPRPCRVSSTGAAIWSRGRARFSSGWRLTR